MLLLFWWRHLTSHGQKNPTSLYVLTANLCKPHSICKPCQELCEAMPESSVWAAATRAKIGKVSVAKLEVIDTWKHCKAKARIGAMYCNMTFRLISFWPSIPFYTMCCLIININYNLITIKLIISDLISTYLCYFVIGTVVSCRTQVDQDEQLALLAEAARCRKLSARNRKGPKGANGTRDIQPHCPICPGSLDYLKILKLPATTNQNYCISLLSRPARWCSKPYPVGMVDSVALSET